MSNIAWCMSSVLRTVKSNLRVVGVIMSKKRRWHIDGMPLYTLVRSGQHVYPTVVFAETSEYFCPFKVLK